MQNALFRPTYSLPENGLPSVTSIWYTYIVTLYLYIHKQKVSQNVLCFATGVILINYVYK